MTFFVIFHTSTAPGFLTHCAEVLHPRRPGGRLQRGLPAEVRHDEASPGRAARPLPGRVETAARAVLFFPLLVVDTTRGLFGSNTI